MAVLTDKQIDEAFALFDQDGSGEIDAEELYHAMKGLGYEVDQGEINALMQKIDKDGNKGVDVNEFRKMLRQREFARDSGEEWDAAFQAFSDGKAFITAADVLRVGRAIGEIPDDATAQEKAEKRFAEYIDHASQAGDGQMTLEDWRKIMQKMKGR
eukprot:TRINITY_DN12727_c0_g1_i1.p2 TRINITY_DN12727_c0_g1~~TRINITY_DN12727_c0_g1_i1.p2  ORF type:complete len:156 (+),score=69.06 TRINITY_DN12727_c0_g1_i1:90-557(+)